MSPLLSNTTPGGIDFSEFKLVNHPLSNTTPGGIDFSESNSTFPVFMNMIPEGRLKIEFKMISPLPLRVILPPIGSEYEYLLLSNTFINSFCVIGLYISYFLK
jgi:hypothetical protein